jgi:signal transduction histidine kinase
MDLKRIDSRYNPLVRRLRRLVASARDCRKEGSTVLEGLHLVAAYEAAQGPVEALVVCESRAGTGEIAAYLAGRSAVCLPDGLFRSLGTLDNPSGVLALASTSIATLRVRDHGPGIAGADRGRALEPFAQLEPARATDGSCGLGLAIVRRIVSGCGGKLSLNDPPDGGLEAIVELPAT